MSETANQRILLSKEEVKKLLGIGDRAFFELGVDYIKLGRRKRYVLDDVHTAINKRRQTALCRLKKGKARHSTGTTLQYTAIAFEEALKQVN